MAFYLTPNLRFLFQWYLRYLLPVVIVMIATISIVIVEYVPLPVRPEFFPRGIVIPISVGLALLALGVWLIGFAPGPRSVRISLLLLGGLLALDCADWSHIHFDGDVRTMHGWRWPIAHWFTDTNADDLLEADRRSRPSAGPAHVGSIRATDFIGYRGGHRDGVVTGPALRRDVGETLRPIWKAPIGGGYSGFAVAGDLAVTLEQRRDVEAVVGYDTATGAERWRHTWPSRFRERMGGDGPRATPTIADGDVYAVGATGHLVCLSAATGQERWHLDVLAGRTNLQWGMAGSPLVVGSLVIVTPGNQNDSNRGAAVLALDRNTGQERWRSGDTQAGYSSPMTATLAGTHQLLLLDGDELAGYDLDTGVKLWHFPWGQTICKINVAQPVVLAGDRVFISSGYGIGAAMIKVARNGGTWSVTELWRSRELKCRFASPVLHDHHLYGLDEGILVCLDAATGSLRWRGDRYGHGQLLRSGDDLIIQAETGFLALVEANSNRFREVWRFQALDNGVKNWNPPALSDGKMYIRNHEQMACYDLTANRSGDDRQTEDR